MGVVGYTDRCVSFITARDQRYMGWLLLCNCLPSACIRLRLLSRRCPLGRRLFQAQVCTRPLVQPNIKANAAEVVVHCSSGLGGREVRGGGGGQVQRRTRTAHCGVASRL